MGKCLPPIRHSFNPAPTRRAFVAGATALAASNLIGSTTGIRAATAPEPVQGGRLRIGIGGASTTDTLDPALVTDIMAPVVTIGQTRNCLMEVDGQGNLIGELAENWEVKPGAAEWRFELRKGVEFHNGKTMDAEDVVYSINHHRKEETQSVVSGIVAPIKELKADGKNAVVITLDSGNADFAYIMSDPHLQIVPAGTTDFSDGMGTGGYVLESWEPGIRAFTRRNPNYWKSGRAHFDEVETLAINDAVARTSALRSEKIDVMNRVHRQTASQLEAMPDIRLVIQDGFKHYTFPMRTDRSPFDNNDVRLALKYAVDRDELVQKVLNGYGFVGNDHPLSPANRYFAEDLSQREYDPDKARFHLEKAGMDSLSVSLHAASVAFQGAVDAAALYSEQAKPAGIDVEVVREPDNGYWSNVWMNEAFCLSYWSGRPTADWIFSEGYAEGANWNETFWAHDEFNRILKEARAELDEQKRREMYAELQRICRDEGGAIIPTFASDLHAASHRLAQPEHVAVNWELDGYRVAERWWFKNPDTE